MSKVYYTDIAGLAGCELPETERKAGASMKKMEVVEHAFLEVEHGLVKSWGSMKDLPESHAPKISLNHQWVLPAFCDAHTHLVFAGSRASEFVDKINGLSYEEIARRGGGILNSAALLHQTSEDRLFEMASERLLEVMKQGTGAIEIKSGYGLNPEAEIKMLRVIRRLKEHFPIPVKSTFLGAHAFPAEFKSNHAAYLRLIIEEMLPKIAGEGLADFIDVFCDTGFFSAAETAQILEAGAKYGLKPKIHANELDFSGGIETGVAYEAVSVDHLECTGEEQIEVLLHSNTIPTVLPGTAFYLGIENAPARKMIDAGLPLALASDFNPGSCPSGNMHFIVALACIRLKLLPEEALNAATINGAAAMDLGRTYGTIAVGRPAHFITISNRNSLAEIPYYFGQSPVSGLYSGHRKLA